eukprot:5528495-Pyramimonas_sp.AAC.1
MEQRLRSRGPPPDAARRGWCSNSIKKSRAPARYSSGSWRGTRGFRPSHKPATSPCALHARCKPSTVRDRRPMPSSAPQSTGSSSSPAGAL